MYIRLIQGIAFMTTKFIPSGISRTIRITLVDGVFDIPSHKGIGILLEGTQAGPCAEIDPLAAIYGAGIVGRVFQFAPAGGFMFRKGGSS